MRSKGDLNRIYDWWANSKKKFNVYPSSDRAIRSASGTNDYESFGNFAFLSNGRAIIPYREAEDHNATPTGSLIRVRLSDDGGLTLSSPITIASGSSTLNVTNPNVSVLDNDRVMISWTEIPVGANLGNPTAVKRVYSDDLKSVAIGSIASATWSSSYTFGQTFSAITFEYIDGPGRAIKMSNGHYLKPIWVTGINVTQPQRVAAYRSTDNGATWSYLSTVLLDATDPVDETCFILMRNGKILAGMRCNSLHKFRYTTSSDNGATWAAATTTSINMYGKPEGVAGPNGTIAIIARDWFGVSNRTILIQSNDNATSFTSAYIDGREGQYMYGQVDYHSTHGLIAMWNIEAQNSTSNQGPTLLIRKILAESRTAISPPTVYDPDYQCLLDFAQAAGETLPTDPHKVIHSNFVASLRSGGKLAQADEYYVPGLNNTNLTAFVKRNWRKPWQVATCDGTLTANGFDFNGTSQKFLTFNTLSNMANFLQNDAEIGVYVFEEGQDAGHVFGSCNGAFSTRTNTTFLNPRYTDDKAYFGINGPVTLQSVTNTTGKALWELKRTNSTSIALHKNGVSFATASTTSTGRSTEKGAFSVERFASADDHFFGSRTLGLMYVGGTKASWNSELTTLRTALGL